MSTAVAYADISLDEVPRYRQYSEATMPDGKVGLKFYNDFLDSYRETRTKPSFVLAWQVSLLANMLNVDTYALSNPKAIIDHPAFQVIRGLGPVAIPLLLKRIDREPVLWLTALPVLVGHSPVLPEHRGRVTQMVADWKRWALENTLGLAR